MKRISLTLSAIFISTGFAFAQQPSGNQNSTVQQIMMQDANIKAVLSEQLDAAHKTIQQLTTENAELKKPKAEPEKAKEPADSKAQP